MKILLITYNWPPKNTVGSLRPYYWAKYLSEISNVEIDVLTSKKYSFDAPLTLSLPELEEVDVYEIPYGNTTKTIGSVLKRVLPPKVREYIKSRLSPRQIKTANMRWGWYEKSKIYLLNNRKKYDCVISTFGPDMCHYLGAFMKELEDRVLWVADYRDLWSLNHIDYLSEESRLMDRDLEKKIVWQKSDLITTVSDGLVEKLKRAGIGKVLKVTNGHDIRRAELISLIEAKREPKTEGELIRILHSGSIYPGFRDPGPFLAAIDRLISKGDIENAVEVEFIGKNLHHLDIYDQKYSFVKVSGEVSRSKSIEKQRDSNFLLLLESSSPDAEGVLTGKLFEYITSGVPVLCAGINEKSELGCVIEDTRTGVVLGSDSEQIESNLRNALCNGSSEFFNPDCDEIMKYGQSTIVSELYFNISSIGEG